MISTVVTINGSAWAVCGDDRLSPLAPTPRITVTVNDVTADINCQYRQITSISHANDCAWGVNLSPTCTCAPHPVNAADAAVLFDAARDVLRRCLDARGDAEQAAGADRLARAADGVYVPVRPGCDPCPSALYGGPCTCC